MAVKLTQKSVDALVAECVKGFQPRDVIDDGCVGLILRLKPRGASWGLKLERGGSTFRLKIGTPGVLTLAQARLIATKAVERVESRIGVPDLDWLHRTFAELGLVEPPAPDGKPPKSPELVAEIAADFKDAPFWTWEQARDAYLAEVARIRRHDTWKDYRTILHMRELDPLKQVWRVKRITRQDLAGIVAGVHASGRERQAEHLASVLRPFWNFMAQDHVRTRSGVEATMAGLKAPERSSGTKLRANGKVAGGYTATPAETGFVVAVSRAGAIERSLGIAMELLVATGQRRRAISTALIADFVQWDEAPGWGVWSMGPLHRKTADRRQDKHRHCIPLPPALWGRIQAQVEIARTGGSPYLFPQIRARKAGGPADGHISPAGINHRLLDLGLRASPHDLRRCLTNTCQRKFRMARSDVKLVIDHNEGFRSDDVLEGHYTEDDRLDLKRPVMERWFAWVEEQAAAAALPDLATLRAQIATRRREREAAGKARMAAARQASEDATRQAA
ncbi:MULTISPECIES: integrase family protein [unclassified Methylobacterium]|uniref:integrase family protein n=1 Tax=unclassified Methylobacterium TaxID=2615210 RepID=UPI0011C20DF1|nr:MULTISPECIES: integrase family protein [unclassified Methylobacterium]QEE39923.1 integrase family protein [Methylobacterium sp. WL1]TXN56589.1 integrase family protein [Methylobacterium sp. WL2]